MSINILPEELINQIAAGEVIENPSAVIKELVENSIDAGSRKIDIEVEESGIKKIIIKDDGVGISREDLLKAPLRHATSKISNFNDLYSIKTMGFRGEALASIFSIAKTKIISKKKENSIAYEISYDDIGLVKESACSNGTIIFVEDMFYNTPARKKYLKSLNLEFKAILDVMRRFELSYFDVAFSLKHNGKLVLNKPSFKNSEDNIYYVLGRDLKGKLIEIDEKQNGIELKGFIGNPSEITYSFKKNQMLFVNNRFVKSKLIVDGVYDGFGSNLMVGRHPIFILFIEIDPEIIDVNIHPSKIELKFENELEIFEFVKKSVREVFEKKSLFKDFEEKSSERNFKLPEISSEVKAVDVKKKNYEKSYFTSEVQKDFQVNENGAEYVPSISSIEVGFDEDKSFDVDVDAGVNVEVEKKEDEVVEYGPLYEELLDYRLLGQLDKTYIVIQTKNDMILIDQHVAEEKFFYEEFKKKFNGKNLQVQKLLKAEVVHLDNSEMLMYGENKEILDGLGFETEVFGLNEIIVRAVPISIRNKIVDGSKLRDFLYEILLNKSIKCVEEEKHSKIASMACRMAVMAGDELTISQMRRIIENLSKLKQPFNCPHGRPTFLKYSLKDLEKKFKRVL